MLYHFLANFLMWDSGGYKRMFDEGGTHIKSVQVISHCRDLAGDDSSTGTIGEPTAISIEVIDQLLGSRAKYKDQDESDGTFWYKNSRCWSEFKSFCDMEVDFAYSSHTDRRSTNSLDSSEGD
jgi:hypothetical protein